MLIHLSLSSVAGTGSWTVARLGCGGLGYRFRLCWDGTLPTPTSSDVAVVRGGLKSRMPTLYQLYTPPFWPSAPVSASEPHLRQRLRYGAHRLGPQVVVRQVQAAQYGSLAHKAAQLRCGQVGQAALLQPQELQALHAGEHLGPGGVMWVIRRA